MNSDPEGKDSLGVEVGVGEDMKSYEFDIEQTFILAKLTASTTKTFFYDRPFKAKHNLVAKIIQFFL